MNLLVGESARPRPVYDDSCMPIAQPSHFCLTDGDDDDDNVMTASSDIDTLFCNVWHGPSFHASHALPAPGARSGREDCLHAACTSPDDSAIGFHTVWGLLHSLDVLLADLSSCCTDALPKPERVTLVLDELIPACSELPSDPSERDCAIVVSKCERFVNSMCEFISDAYHKCDVLAEEPYMTAGFFESCFCVEFMLLEDLESFFEPSIISELIEFEYDGT